MEKTYENGYDPIERYQTYPHAGCHGDMEWIDDFTVNGFKVVIHACTVCGAREKRKYDTSTSRRG